MIPEELNVPLHEDEETGELIPVYEQPKVTCLEEANVMLRKLRFVKGKEQEYKAIAENELKRIQQWLKKETEQLTGIAEWYEWQLKEYYQAERAKNEKFKLTTPYGKVSSRRTKKFHWDVEQELAEQLLAEGKKEVVRQKIELDKTAFKKMFPDGINTETGEVLVKVTEEESVSVKVE